VLAGGAFGELRTRMSREVDTLETVRDSGMAGLLRAMNSAAVRPIAGDSPCCSADPFAAMGGMLGHWKGKSRRSDIDSGLDALIADVRRLGIRSIAVPPLGCGLGEIDHCARLRRWSGWLPTLRSASSRTWSSRYFFAACTKPPTSAVSSSRAIKSDRLMRGGGSCCGEGSFLAAAVMGGRFSMTFPSPRHHRRRNARARNATSPRAVSPSTGASMQRWIRCWLRFGIRATAGEDTAPEE